VKWWPHAAAAAGLAGVVAAMALLGNGSNVESSREVGSVDSVMSGASVVQAQVRPVRAWLAHQPAEPVVVRMDSRIAVTNLEDRIAWFDDVLMNERLQGGDAEQIKVLQQERARLIRTLAQVRYAEVLVAGGS
jgi:hypothetical protein